MVTSNNLLIIRKNIYCENGIRLTKENTLEVVTRRDLYLCIMALRVSLREI